MKNGTHTYTADEELYSHPLSDTIVKGSIQSQFKSGIQQKCRTIPVISIYPIITQMKNRIHTHYLYICNNQTYIIMQ